MVAPLWCYTHIPAVTIPQLSSTVAANFCFTPPNARLKNTNLKGLLFVWCVFEPSLLVHWWCLEWTLEVQISFPGISSCHFRLLVPVHPMGNTLIWGEALLKVSERPIHSEWYEGSIMSLSLAATLGLTRPPITLHKASYSFGWG